MERSSGSDKIELYDDNGTGDIRVVVYLPASASMCAKIMQEGAKWGLGFKHKEEDS